MKTRRIAIAVTLAMASGLALAKGAFNQTDKRFVTEAANSGVYETQVAQVAEKRAQSPEVKAYAGMLLREHEKSNDALKKLAASKSMTLPRELPHEFRGRVQGFEREDVGSFDREFLQKLGLDDHDKSIELFERAADRATSVELKNFAKAQLPVLRKHRERAQELMEKLPK